MAEGTRQTLGFAQYTASTGVKSLADTPATGAKAPDGAYAFTMTVEVQNIRWRGDGTNPTAAIGILQKPTDPPLQYDGDIDKFRWIEAVAGAIINVQYFGMG